MNILTQRGWFYPHTESQRKFLSSHGVTEDTEWGTEDYF